MDQPDQTSQTSLVESFFALTSDGALVLNARALFSAEDNGALLAMAEQEADVVFIGVRLTPAEAARVFSRIKDAGAEAAARLFAQRRRRARRRTRSTRS